MSEGFSQQWLALREPVDHASINPHLRAKLIAALPHYPQHVSITDLGCGTGSNLRALAPYILTHQHWLLCDHDAALLGYAAQSLRAWAHEARVMPDGLHLRYGAYDIHVEFRLCDLVRDYAHVLARPCDLVTAAAFFDLAGQTWIEHFCQALNTHFYTVLSYDGRELWHPPHNADAQMLEAFHHHQHSDKGLGPALGPQAHALLMDLLAQKSWMVEEAESNWVLDARHSELIAALAQGSAQAVRHTGRVDQARVDDWLAARYHASSCLIGHKDLLALRL
jgi:SAM-dependent methyltransferase